MTSSVTVVVAIGRSGRVAVPSVRAAILAGAAHVVLAVDATEADDVRRMVATSAPSVEVVVAGSTLARQRNAGVAAASDEVVVVVDGGSLVTASWLEAAARAAAGEAIVRPEYVVAFGAAGGIWPQRQPRGGRLLPIVTPQGAPVAARREVLRALPFPDVPDDVVDAAWQALIARDGHATVIADATAVLVRTWGSDAPFARPPGAGVPATPADPDPLAAQSRRPRQGSRLARLSGEAVRSVLRPWVSGARRVRRRLGARRSLPGWLLPQLADLHALEPLVPYPHPLVGDRFERWGDPWPSAVVREAARYAQLRAALPERVDYLLIAPWLRLGGGDQVLLDYAAAIRRLDPEGVIALITTEPVRSTRLGELPRDARAVELLDLFDVRAERDLLADRVLPQLFADLAPHTIHAFNSSLAFDVVERHPDRLDARIFLSSFAIDRAPSGEQTSALFHRTPRFLDAVDAVLVDSDRFVARLTEEHGYDPRVFRVQPHVVPTVTVAGATADRAAGEPLHVLWVGRFDLPKRLDVLASIARAVADEALPVVIEFYGQEEMGDPTLPATLETLKAAGAVRHPPYHGFATLPLERYGAYVMTSEWEGLPLSLLEAMSAGLPVVAPRVGAIGDIVGDATGYLVERFDDVGAYLAALRAIIADPLDASGRAARGRRVVHERFSATAFDAALRSVLGYLRDGIPETDSTRREG